MKKLNKVHEDLWNTSTIDLAKALNKAIDNIKELERLIKQMEKRIRELNEKTDPHRLAGYVD